MESFLVSYKNQSVALPKQSLHRKCVPVSFPKKFRAAVQ